MTGHTLPTWNPFQKGYRENPSLQLDVLRRENPVHKAINGRWLVLRYDDVKHVLHSPAFQTVKFSKALAEKQKYAREIGSVDKLSEISARWLLFYDPPEHTEMRSMLMKIWNRLDLTGVVERVTAENLSDLSSRRYADLVHDFATFIPSKVICHILGLPSADYRKFRRWSYSLNSMFEPFATLHDFVVYNQNIGEFYDYIDHMIGGKQRQPDEGFISQFIAENAKFSVPLERSGVISVVAFMFFASIETSVNLFGQSVLYLLQNPRQFSLLAEDESIIPTAVEELLRFISPNQYTTRVAAVDTEIRGAKIKQGDLLMAATVSANRDETVFDNGGELDLRRHPNPHLSFGYGLHFCLGAKLARFELQKSLPALLRSFPRMALRPDDPFEWDKIILNRGLKSLPVVLT